MFLSLLLNLLLASSIVSAPPSYRAIVIDARTREPLPGVTVLDLENHVNIVSDATGRFGVETLPVSLRLSYVGYSSLEINRSSSNGILDTLFLKPAVVTLENVTVTPTRPVLLTPIARSNSRQPGLSLYPGSQVAILQRPASGQRITHIDALLLRLSGDPVVAGRVRVRLLLANGPTDSDTPPQPGAHELLPAPLEFTAAQLAANPKQLVIDLTKFQLTWPAEGVYIMLDGLTSDPAEKYVKAAVFTTKKGPEIRAVTTIGGVEHTTPVDDFAGLATSFSAAPTRTWTWNTKRAEWIPLASSKTFGSDTAIGATNCAVALVVQSR